MRIKSLRKAKKLKGKVVVVRGSLNVPLNYTGEITDDFRLRMMKPTLDYLAEQGARVVLLGHLGRDSKNTLEPIAKYLGIYLDKNTFQNFNVQQTKDKIAELKDGGVLLLDNLRQNDKEGDNDEEFKHQLKSLGDIYVQEAFSVSHRKHASMTIKPDFYGFQYEKEIENLKRVMKPKSPSIFILGGAKIRSKTPILLEALKKYDQVVVGGAIANNFYQHLGLEVGDSLVEEMDRKILEDILMKDNFVLPDPDMLVWKDNKILDIAPDFFEKMRADFENAKFIFMNGPMGYYEDGFIAGTEKVLELSASPDNFFLVGGGDTAATIFKLGLEKNTDFISTGGGALIHFLTKK